MSNFCDVCKREYPDDQPVCPHCAEAEDVTLAEAVDFGLPAHSQDPRSGDPARHAADSGDLGVGDWAALIDEPEAKSAASSARFDAPSDADLLGRSADKELAAQHKKDEEADLEAVEDVLELSPSAILTPEDEAARSSSGILLGADDVIPADDDSSAVDLLAAGASAHDLPPLRADDPSAVAPVDSGVDLSEDATMRPGAGDAPFVMAAESSVVVPGAKEEEPPVVELTDSGILLEEDDVVDAVPVAEADESGVLLTEEAIVDDVPVVEADESGILLTEEAIEDEAPVVEAGESGVLLTEEAIVDEPGKIPSDSDINLGDDALIEKHAPNAGDSGRDLIAEEVESGVGLHRVGVEPASSGRHEDAEVIDLVDVVEAPAEDEVLVEMDEEVDLTAATLDDQSSAVDLGGSSMEFPAVTKDEPAAEEAAEIDGGTQPHRRTVENIHGGVELSPSEVNLGGKHDERGKTDSADYFDAVAGLGEDVGMVEDDEAPTIAADSGALHGDDLGVVEDDEELQAVVEDEALAGEEEPVAVGMVEDDRPGRRPPKEKRRSAVGAFIGSMFLIFLGLVLGAGGLFGAWLFGVEPQPEWRQMVGVSTPAPKANPNPQPGPGTPAPMTTADKTALVKNGDLDKAAQANIETIDEAKSDETAARGEFRARKYLQLMAAKPAADPDVAAAKDKAVADLEKAKDNNADALFWLGVVNEASGKLDEAEKAYKKGLERFEKDPVQRQRFEDALTRLALRQPLKVGRLDAPAAVALLLTALQPEQPPPPPATPTAEAGSEFWRAVKLARDQQYAEAGKALDSAAEIHAKRRFNQLGKAQNPNSDPTEEIFLRSCEELKTAWALREKLGTLEATKGKDPVKAVEDLVAANKDAAGKLKKAEGDLETTKKDLDAAIDTAKKDADAAKKDLDAAKETAKKELDAVKETAKKEVDAAKKERDAAKTEIDVLTTKVEAADAARKQVAEVLKPLYPKAVTDEAALVPSVKDAMRLAQADHGKMILDLEKDLAGTKADLKERWLPSEMLTFWLPVVEERGRKGLAGKAMLDADRVLKDETALAAVKGRAHAIKGLALRDEEKYPEAKAELEMAREGLDAGEWLRATDAALKEASDPAAWFLRRAEELRDRGQGIEALAVLDHALEIAPEGKTKYLILRSEMLLDEARARGKGRADPGDPDFVAARKDAEEAVKDKDPEAFYAAGRIAEELERFDDAIQAYRQALAAHPALDAAGGRYRVALARALVQPRPVKPVPVGKGAAPASPGFVAALLTVALEPPGQQGLMDETTKEALKLADEILNAKDGNIPFEVRAQALAIKGLHTQALTLYAEGLRPSLSRTHADQLMTLIQTHPLLRRPTSLTVSNPLEAERHYGSGLRFFFDRQYGKAEQEFLDAVEQDGQDARYFYFLGLTRLIQDKRDDAVGDFELGARLEKRNRPSPAAVSAALERIQGPNRQMLNDFRDQPR